MEFQSFQRDRLHVHIHNTDKFKTSHLGLKLARPLAADTVTATAILPYLWMEGTKTYQTAEDLLRYVDELYGASLRTGITKRGDRQVLEAYVGVPDESALGSGAVGLWQRATDLLFEVVTQPATVNGRFPDTHLNRELPLHRHRIESIFDDKMAFAADRCVAEACGDAAARLPRLGYLRDLADMTSERLWTAHEGVLTQADAHLYVVGHFPNTEQLAERLLQRLESSLPAAMRAQHAPARALTPERAEVHTVTEEQHITQGKLDFAYRTGVNVASSDYPAMMVTNGIFGGFMHSKLFKHVREEASLAYYCHSRFDNLTGLVLVETGIEVKNREQTLDIVAAQLEAIKSGSISEDEMAFTKSSIRNQYTQLADYPMNVADVHFNTVIGGTKRSVRELLEQVEAVTADDVMRMAHTLRLDTVYLLKGKEVVAHA